MRTVRVALMVVLFAGLCLLSTPARAQSEADSPVWGASVSVLTVPHTAFSRLNPALPEMASSNLGNGAVCFDISTDCWMKGGFSLPTGARIVGVDLEACDPVTGGEAIVVLSSCPVNTNACSNVATVRTGLAGTPGCATISSGALDVTVQNATAYYPLILTLDDNSISVVFRAVRIRYQLQVSPPPGTATFPNDVPTTHPLFRFVEALAASGVTGGCGSGAFCPNDPLTRGQMAVFLSVALGMHFPN